MKFFTKITKSSELLVHMIAWAIIFLLPYIFSSEYNGGSRSRADNDEQMFTYLDTITKIFWVILFYLNLGVIIPKILYKKKYFTFAIIQIIIFAGIMLVHGYLFELVITDRYFKFLRSASHNIIPFLFTVMASIAYKTITDKARDDARASEQQKENLKTELSFLRSQISPHFLFNVLNNMVALVRTKSEELEPTIIKLSSLMHYMLYETDEEKVLLRNEVEYLQSYIDLQKQRFSDKLRLDVVFDIEEDWHSIEPMLLIPFVENAFKHGVGLVQDPVILIVLTVVDNQLEFSVKNKYKSSDTVKDKTSGIGLANVKRRLELLYGKNYQLNIDQTDEWFSVDLKLTFKT